LNDNFFAKQLSEREKKCVELFTKCQDDCNSMELNNQKEPKENRKFNENKKNQIKMCLERCYEEGEICFQEAQEIDEKENKNDCEKECTENYERCYSECENIKSEEFGNTLRRERKTKRGLEKERGDESENLGAEEKGFINLFVYVYINFYYFFFN